jgi:hypothetical protein
MFKANEGSTRNLMQMCVAYFLCYVITGLTVKYFLGNPALGLPGMKGLQFLAYSTLGASPFVTLYVLIRRWYKIESAHRINFLGMKLPIELLYIIPSGICTGIVIPTTTLMYTLPISVMVAMVIMRGSVIVISRLVDYIQIKQGILHKKVYKEENLGVLFAVAAIGIHVVWAGSGSFDFLGSTAAMSILGAYVGSYAIRIYIMNYYKNTAGHGVKRDNKAFFAIEQFAAFFTMVIAVIVVFNSPTLFGWNFDQVNVFREAIINPLPNWHWASLAGTAFGLAAFFSVFIFMFKGRTATFAGLVNRLTSLMAGTTATLLFHYLFGGKFPKTQDWISLAFILTAVAFLTKAERKRSAELAMTHELEIEEGELEASKAAA